MNHARRLLLAVTMLSLALTALHTAAPAAQPSGTTAFTHVNVLTMRTEDNLADYTVIVRDGRIAELASASVKVPKDAAVIDGQGAYLMPGLVDMHVHVATADDFLSFLAHGVTTVANLCGSPQYLRWRQMLRDGKMVGPNLYTTGPIIDGRPLTGMFAAAKTAEQARTLVADQKHAGYDWIKVYSSLQPEAYHAILGEANKQRVPVIGHVPWFVRDVDELKRGQIMVAHGEEFVGGIFGGIHPEKIPKVTRAVKEAGITVTPNLVAYTIMLTSVRDVHRLLDDPECAYLSPCAWSQWLPSNNRYSNRDPNTFGAKLEAGHAFIAKFTKAFHDAGVPLLVGTDTEITGFPGRSAVEEIQELVAAGLSRRDALLAATKNAGDFVMKTVPGETPFGTIAVGQRADLILLSGNPLENPDNLKRLKGVMVRGRWWPSARIAEMREALVPRYQLLKKDVARLCARIDQKQVGEAAKVFRALRRAYPQDDFIYYFVLYDLMQTAIQGQRLQDALELAKMNDELHPDNFAVRAQLGAVYRRTGNKPAAAKCLKESLEWCPGNAVALEELQRLKATP